MIGWFNAGTDQDSVEPDLFGTCMLPSPSACFGPSESNYTSKTREILHAHLRVDQTQAMPWPKELRKCFANSAPEKAHGLIGSPVLDVSLGRVDAVGTCLDEMFGVDRKRSDEDYTQFDNNLPPEMPTEWVQCEECLKWRRVPFHVDLSDLPDVWLCKMNFWDEPEKANCDAPQDAFDPEKEGTVNCSAWLNDGGVETCRVGDMKDVYCLRNEIFYEAKVLRIRKSRKEGKEEEEALFHFKGWKSNNDEWISVSSPRIVAHHMFTDATKSRVQDQEKWQGYKLKKQAAPPKGKKRTSKEPKAPAPKKSRKSK